MSRPYDPEFEQLVRYLSRNDGARPAEIVRAVYGHLSRATAYRRLDEARRRCLVAAYAGGGGVPGSCRAACPHQVHTHVYITVQGRLLLASLGAWQT